MVGDFTRGTVPGRTVVAQQWVIAVGALVGQPVGDVLERLLAARATGVFVRFR